MTDSLFKPVPPTQPGWYYCQRVNSDDCDCCLLTHWGLWVVPSCGEPLKPQTMQEKYLFGPRVPMPVAEPVERYSVMADHGFGAAYTSVENCVIVKNIGGGGIIYRGVFTPTEIMTP